MIARIVLITGALMLGAGTATALELPDKYPVEGVQTTITLSQPVDEISFTYQPSAPIARTVTLKTGGATQVPWTPEQAGIVSINAGDEQKDVSVRFAGTPALGVLIFLLAALVLFGGATVCLRALFAQSARDDSED